MKRVLVVGYPKSGCTWATRLVAELIGCPVAGFWQRERKEIAIEGEDRISAYRCYKSHHQLAELETMPNEPDTWLIYILRDPRDIAISSATHFQFDRFPYLADFFRRFRRGEKFYRHTLYPLLVRRNYRLEEMTTALLEGSGRVHNWVRVSWRDHWRPYQAAGIPIVRYEDLLANPAEECTRILRHLGLARSNEEIAGRGGKPVIRTEKANPSRTGRNRPGEIPPRGQERPVARTATARPPTTLHRRAWS